MTLAVQVSAKTNNGTIFVIGGNDVDEFHANLVALYAGPTDDADAANAAAEEILEAMAQALSPMGAAVQNVQNAFPGSQVVQGGPPSTMAAYGHQGPPQPQYGGAPGGEVILRIPWKDKTFADPYLAPLKQNRQVRWDADRKVWIVAPGVPIAGLERWVSA